MFLALFQYNGQTHKLHLAVACWTYLLTMVLLKSLTHHACRNCGLIMFWTGFQYISLTPGSPVEHHVPLDPTLVFPSVFLGLRREMNL